MDVNLKGKPFLLLSGANVVIFILSLALDAATNSIFTDYQGIWCGIFYLITASLCFILHFKRQDRNIIIAALMSSCLSVVFGLVAAGLSGSNADSISYVCKIVYLKDCGLQWAVMIFSLCAVIVNGALSYILFLNLQKSQSSVGNRQDEVVYEDAQHYNVQRQPTVPGQDSVGIHHQSNIYTETN